MALWTICRLRHAELHLRPPPLGALALAPRAPSWPLQLAEASRWPKPMHRGHDAVPPLCAGG